MKLDTPSLPPDTPVELRQWIEKVADLVNRGFYAPKVFTTAPTVTQINTGELAYGRATGPAAQHEIFIKVNDTTIGRWYHDATIT